MSDKQYRYEALSRFLVIMTVLCVVGLACASAEILPAFLIEGTSIDTLNTHANSLPIEPSPSQPIILNAAPVAQNATVMPSSSARTSPHKAASSHASLGKHKQSTRRKKAVSLSATTHPAIKLVPRPSLPVHFSLPAHPISQKKKPVSNSSSSPLTTDPELQPFTLYERTQNTTAQKSGDLLTQLAINLGIVLILFIGFARWALPRLIVRYPQFFENLRRYHENGQHHRSNLESSSSEKIQNQTSSQSQSETIAPPTTISALSEPKKLITGVFSHSKKPDQFKNWLKLQQKHGKDNVFMDSSSLCVLTSTTLGAGRELHLVDVPGLNASRRRLLLASTPEGISILQDLSEQQPQRIFSRIETDLSRMAMTTRPDFSNKSVSPEFIQPSTRIHALSLQADEEITVLPDYDDTY